MAISVLPPIKTLRQILDICPENGALIWRQRPAELFAKCAAADSWNRRFAGTRADKPPTQRGHYGYRFVLIFNRPYRAHRVIWAISTGRWPDGQIDHINGDRTDNRLANLRDVGDLENRRNTSVLPSNTSGVPGVRLRTDRATVRWTARISDGARNLHLGTFDTFEEAVRARREAESRLGYHPNHGRSAS